MPRLLLFVPCEKALIEARNNTLSLISVLSEVRFQRAANEDIPLNAAVPLQWMVVSVWERNADDQTNDFQQLVQLHSPSNRLLLENRSSWRFGNQRFHRVLSQLLAFPIGETGNLTLSISLRSTSSNDWTKVESYPLELIEESSSSVVSPN
jgi:hypothetical protein